MRRIYRFCVMAVILALCVSAMGCGTENATQDTTLSQQNSTAAVTEPTLPRGNRIGDRAYGYAVPVYNSEGETGETIDPTATGKVTVINFWGIWCNPCVNELPHFEQFAKDYADKVTIVAIHSAGDSQSLPDFLAENYPDSGIIFARDVGEEFNGEYYNLLGCKDYYPYNIVLDAQGIIRFIEPGALSYEQLQAIIAEFDPSFA